MGSDSSYLFKEMETEWVSLFTLMRLKLESFSPNQNDAKQTERVN